MGHNAANLYHDVRALNSSIPAWPFIQLYHGQRRTTSTCRSGQVTFLPPLWYSILQAYTAPVYSFGTYLKVKT